MRNAVAEAFEAKRQLRKQMEASRNALPEDERGRASRLICAQAARLVEAKALGHERPTLFTFVPFRTEVNVRPLIEWAWQRGMRVIVPRVDRALGEMSLHVIDAYNQLVPGAWGIYEPALELEAFHSIAEISTVIVPGLAFDRAGGRLGYGQGFYDRYVQRYDRSGLQRPIMIGVGFNIQVVDELPMEPHDLRVTYVVTESGEIGGQCS